MQSKLQINVRTILHEKQRYDTVGDWIWVGGDCLNIHVSDMGDWRYEALIAVHELIEAILCRQAGVSTEMVDQFDLNFPGQDPGASLAAPYHDQHLIATAVEMMLAGELRVDWGRYDEACGGTNHGED